MSGESHDRHHGIDTDRDAMGQLLPTRLRPVVQRSTRQLQATVAELPMSNAGTEPKQTRGDKPHRVVGIEQTTQLPTRKRKRVAVAALPPPSFAYQRTNDPRFNIFHGFLLYPELCFCLASHMPTKRLIDLYAISQDFHRIINERLTTVCLDQARTKAPVSAEIFHFRAYKQFCRPDPAARIPHPDPRKAAVRQPRVIPSFRWVQFVLYREKVVHEIFALLAERGIPLPARCATAMKKMWFLHDMPANHLRIGAVHNANLVSDLDLYFAMCFYVKLDLACQDPLAPVKRDELRMLMCSMPDGFTTVLRVLKRELWRSKQDFTQAWVRHSLNIPGVDDIENQSLEGLSGVLGKKTVLGVPLDEVGVIQYEYWGNRGRFRKPVRRDEHGRRIKWQKLMRPDQLIMREAIRRGFRFTKHFFRCLLAGYVRPDTLDNYAPRDHPHRIADWHDEEYAIGDTVGGVRALSPSLGGDAVLDLGNTDPGSLWTKAEEAVSQQERLTRDEQDKQHYHFRRMWADEMGIPAASVLE